MTKASKAKNEKYHEDTRSGFFPGPRSDSPYGDDDHTVGKPKADFSTSLDHMGTSSGDDED